GAGSTTCLCLTNFASKSATIFANCGMRATATIAPFAHASALMPKSSGTLPFYHNSQAIRSYNQLLYCVFNGDRRSTQREVIPRRPDFRPSGIRLVCIASNVRAFSLKSSQSYLRIFRVAFRRGSFWEPIHKVENKIVAAEREIFRRG